MRYLLEECSGSRFVVLFIVQLGIITKYANSCCCCCFLLVQSELDIVAEHRAESKFFIIEVLLNSL